MNTLALVASKLLNFAPALSNLNVSEYLSNPQIRQCKESKFYYEPIGHVITGDLRVKENAKLREVVSKGPKYRETNKATGKLQKQCVWNLLISIQKLVQKRTSGTQVSL